MFRDDKGNFSTMRVLAVLSSMVGYFMCVWGAWHGDATCMTVGGGLAAVTNAAKAWQKQAENK